MIDDKTIKKIQYKDLSVIFYHAPNGSVSCDMNFSENAYIKNPRLLDIVSTHLHPNDHIILDKKEMKITIFGLPVGMFFNHFTFQLVSLVEKKTIDIDMSHTRPMSHKEPIDRPLHTNFQPV